MADLIEDEDYAEVIGPAPHAPDLSDLQSVIFNVELRDGAKYSLIVARQEGQRLSLTSDHEGDYAEVRDGTGRVVDVRFFGPQAWEFILRTEEIQ